MYIVTEKVNLDIILVQFLLVKQSNKHRKCWFGDCCFFELKFTSAMENSFIMCFFSSNFGKIIFKDNKLLHQLKK